jgi:hypothetical protein
MRTSLYSILCIAIRIGAVLIAVQTIVQIIVMLPDVLPQSVESGAWSWGEVASAVGASWLLAAWLWIYPGVLARLAAGRSANQVFESPINADEIQRIALTVLGIWFVMVAIIELVRTGLDFAWARIWMSDSINDRYVRQIFMGLISYVCELAFGIALTLGSAGLTGWLRAIRERGLPPAVSDTDVEP